MVKGKTGENHTTVRDVPASHVQRNHPALSQQRVSYSAGERVRMQLVFLLMAGAFGVSSFVSGMIPLAATFSSTSLRTIVCRA